MPPSNSAQSLPTQFKQQSSGSLVSTSDYSLSSNMNESEKEVLEGDLGSVHNIVRLPIQEIYGTETVKQEPGEEQDVEKGTASGLKDENPQRLSLIHI